MNGCGTEPVARLTTSRSVTSAGHENTRRAADMHGPSVLGSGVSGSTDLGDLNQRAGVGRWRAHVFFGAAGVAGRTRRSRRPLSRWELADCLWGLYEGPPRCLLDQLGSGMRLRDVNGVAAGLLGDRRPRRGSRRRTSCFSAADILPQL